MEKRIRNEALAEKLLSLSEQKEYHTARGLLLDENEVDIAEILSFLPEDACLILFRLLPKDMAADVFVEMENEDKEALLSAFSDTEMRHVLSDIYLDDAADLIEEMPAGLVERILKNTDKETRDELNDLLRYPKDSAGALMTPEFVLLRKDFTVQEAFDTIRRVAIDKETVYTCYVTDEKRRLLGIVTVKELLLADTAAVIEDLMEDNVISVTTDTDREEVAFLINKYDFLALPVVDSENRLVGIVTVDDAIDVIQEEAEEDFTKMAAITPTEEPYLRTSVLKIWLSRIPWLVLLMLSATFTGGIISSFESALSVCVALTAFIPMLMGTGGNSGSQASVSVIRGLSTGEIGTRDLLRVLYKELRVSLLSATTLGALSFGKLLLVDYLWLHAIPGDQFPLLIAFTVSAALAATVIFAKLVGAALPILAKKLGLDPAVMASPFITTVVDAVSLLLYFGIANAVLLPKLL